jgi:D-alanyl-D-alanine carboxypeptidase
MAVVLGEPTGAERTLRAASLLEYGFQQYAWKRLFDASSIDTLPVATDAKGITNMRQSVVSWECGTGRKARAPRKAKGKGGRAKKPKTVEAGAPNGAGAASAAAALTPASAADSETRSVNSEGNWATGGQGNN